MAIAATDMVDRVEQLLALTARLTVLIKAETEALKARKLDASSKDWDEKERLAHTYRSEMSDLSKKPDLLLTVPRELRKKLFEATQSFQEVLSAHEKALSTMRQISEGLVETIAREVAAEKAGPASYGAFGQTTQKRAASGLAVNARA